MKTDYAYCSGILCRIREKCRRYLPDPPDIPLFWVPPEYDKETGDCPIMDRGEETERVSDPSRVNAEKDLKQTI